MKSAWLWLWRYLLNADCRVMGCVIVLVLKSNWFGGLIPDKFIGQSRKLVEVDHEPELYMNFPFLYCSIWLRRKQVIEWKIDLDPIILFLFEKKNPYWYSTFGLNWVDDGKSIISISCLFILWCQQLSGALQWGLFSLNNFRKLQQIGVSCYRFWGA